VTPRALHIQNEASGPARVFVEALEARRFEIRTIDARLDRLPESPEGFAAILSGGGSADTHQTAEHPWLIHEVALLRRAIEAGARGVVLSQGTDTLEETAFLVDLVCAHAEHFVVTGAMRNPTLAGPDGPATLLAAARVAASPDARALRALVVLNDEIHAARWVRKQHSTSTATFGSADAGPLGHVIEGRVRLLTRLLRPQPLPVPDRDRLGARRVALHVVSLEDDGDRLDGLADTHEGLVVAGFGVGHVPAARAPRLGALAERIPVVLTSRTGGGSVLSHTYGAPGSEVDLLRRGLVNGGLLDPYKARILLRLLLAAGSDRAAIAREFAERG